MQKIKTKVTRRKLKDLRPLGGESMKNARFMTPQEHAKLVANLKLNGCLTSVPLIAQVKGNKDWFICSGNHRVDAAIEAGIIEADVMEVEKPLSKADFVSLQLSHNKIEGQDDPNTLRELYDSLTLNQKQFTGLTSDDFKVEDVEVTTMVNITPAYYEVSMIFLKEDFEGLQKYIEDIAKMSEKKGIVGINPYDQFQEFFTNIADFKEATNILSTATAISVLINRAKIEVAKEQAKSEGDDK